jgi:hypothetical protein
MKKRIFIGMAALFFAAITFYNVQVNQNDGDISLENVALMAQASGEGGMFDNSKSIRRTAAGNYCCCPSSQEYCGAHWTCNESIC